MNGDQEKTEGDDLESNEGSEDTIVIDTENDDETIADITGEVNVEELVAKLEATSSDDRKRAIRLRLEELAEERDSDLDSTYNFNLDDDDL